MDTDTNTNNGNTDDTDTSTNNDQAAKTFTQEEVNTMMATQKGNVEKKFNSKFEGVNVEEYTQLKEDKAKADRKKQVDKGEFETILQEQATKHNAEIAQYKTRETEYTINSPIINAAAQHKAINPEQVRSLLKGDFRLGDTGEVEVLDKDGKARYDNDGKPFTVDNRVREFLDSNPHFVSATPSTTNSQSNTEVKIPGDLDITKLDMKNPDDRAKYAEYRKTAGIA